MKDHTEEIEEKIKESIAFPYKEFLDKESFLAIRAKSSMVKYARKEIIFRQNTPTSHCMFINRGLVKIFKEGKDNKFILLKVAKAGDFLGLMSVMGSDIHQYSASAIEDSEIVYVDIDAFRQIINNQGLYSEQLVSYLAKYGLYIFDRMMSLSHKQLPGRIADVLLYFSELIYDSHKFTFPLTRKELAELAGTTKESFIRTLTEFKNDKIINLDGSEVEIVSMKLVRTLSKLG